MANIDLNALVGNLKNDVTALALSSIQNYAAEAKADGLKFVESIKTDLKTWATEFAEGKMSKEDVEFLVLAKKELIEMNALKQAGLGLIKIDAFRNSLLNFNCENYCGLSVMADNRQTAHSGQTDLKQLSI